MPSKDDYVEEPEPMEAQKVARPRVEELDEILGVPLKVLDDGFVRVVDYMGSDESIVQAARVSYGKGTKKVSQDRGLIRYLMRHRHTTPFEMADIKFHVRVPMDCWRQWIRHRTACLAEGTEVYFDLPGGIKRRGNQLYKIKIEELWDRFQRTENRTRPDKQRNPYFRRDRARDMKLRQVNEDTLRLQHTRVVDVYRNGAKPVFRITLEDGKQIEATAGHKFLFEDGWSTLKQATELHESNGKAVWNRGDYSLFVNGLVCEAPAPSQDKITIARLVRIADIEYAGEKMTYDVEVEGPYHNFVANGIVTHNSVNEYSTRYSIAINATQQTAPEEWRLQSALNKQGSDASLDAA
ncbi:MAG: FAD-dependent thymidylate synthase, partial [Candidatus Krumholzibacteria bacterium]|nr:FAD-dependent thymidylate synthase [Candidatus Krumholzibacteria bacterium]